MVRVLGEEGKKKDAASSIVHLFCLPLSNRSEVLQMMHGPVSQVGGKNVRREEKDRGG